MMTTTERTTACRLVVHPSGTSAVLELGNYAMDIDSERQAFVEGLRRETELTSDQLTWLIGGPDNELMLSSRDIVHDHMTWRYIAEALTVRLGVHVHAVTADDTNAWMDRLSLSELATLGANVMSRIQAKTTQS